jgi:2-polyprenyl-3-methyl-5-hydroxy-6-metoxy-1,4-benzoquinol methylase
LAISEHVSHPSPSPVPASFTSAISYHYRNAAFLQRLLLQARLTICPPQFVLDEVPPGSRVLDIGCGNGMWLTLLASQNKICSGIGCDINLASIATAQTVTRDPAMQHLSFVVQPDGATIPEGSFDCVLLIDVLHHVPRAAQPSCIAAAASRVRPGGRFIYKDMSTRSWWRALVNRTHDLVLAQQWIHYVQKEQVIGWAEAAGLRLRGGHDYDSLA